MNALDGLLRSARRIPARFPIRGNQGRETASERLGTVRHARVIRTGCALGVLAAGLAVGAASAAPAPVDSRPVCKSAIASIRIVGNRTVRGPVVWYPAGCKHPANRTGRS